VFDIFCVRHFFVQHFFVLTFFRSTFLTSTKTLVPWRKNLFEAWAWGVNSRQECGEPPLSLAFVNTILIYSLSVYIRVLLCIILLCLQVFIFISCTNNANKVPNNSSSILTALFTFLFSVPKTFPLRDSNWWYLHSWIGFHATVVTPVKTVLGHLGLWPNVASFLQYSIVF
jgi:hypothetical protein